MASDRNRNAKGDYLMEQRKNIATVDYYTEKMYGMPYTSYHPGDGLLSGRVASENLAKNYCDIESQLRGIGANNLVAPQPEVTPDLYNLNSLSTINRLPLLLPEPLVLQENQRPQFR